MANWTFDNTNKGINWFSQPGTAVEKKDPWAWEADAANKWAETGWSYGKQLADIGLQSTLKSAPTYDQMQGWMKNLASGGNMGALPSWMQINWKQPFTRDQLNQLTQMQDLTTQQQGQAIGNQAMGSLARRGLSTPSSTSTADIASSAGLQNWLAQQQAQNQYNVGMAGIQRGDQLRQEQASNYNNLANMLQAREQSLWPYTSTTPYMANSVSLANMYRDQGNQEASNNANWWNMLGQGIGLFL